MRLAELVNLTQVEQSVIGCEITARILNLRAMTAHFLTIALMAATLFATNAQEVLLDYSTNNIGRRILLLPTSAFDVVNVESLVRQYLTLQPTERLLQFQVVSERMQAYTVPKSRAYSFDRWLSDYEQLKSRNLPMAEAISMSGWAVFRFRDRSGNLRKMVLSGSDPLRFRIGTNAFDIVHIDFHGSPDSGYAITVFVTSSVLPTTPDAERFVKALAGRAGLPTIFVRIRTDAWFVADPGFPVYHPLLSDTGNPISRTAYESSNTVSCFWKMGEASCATFHN
jgi:hypothetical protein